MATNSVANTATLLSTTQTASQLLMQSSKKDRDFLTSRQLKVYVHLGFGFGAEQHRKLHEDGKASDPVPYGFHHAESMGCDLTYSQDFPESKLIRFIRRALTRVLGFDILHAYRNRSAIREAEVVWTMEELQYLAVLFLSLIYPPARKIPVIAQTIWLFDRWHNTSPLRRWFLHHLLRRASLLTVHSKKYVMMPELKTLDIHPLFLPFGISSEAFSSFSETHSASDPLRILSMGSDPTRDWQTLLEAFGKDSRFEVIGVSKNLSDERIKPYPSVTVRRNPSMSEFRSLYEWADFVVIPMSENNYSGITVALEAACIGVPVICSNTGGVPSYFDEGEVIYTPVADPRALRNAALAITDEQRATLVRAARKRFQAEDYSTRGMAGRYVLLTRQILEEARAGEFSPQGI